MSLYRETPCKHGRMRNHRIADVTCSSGYCPHTPIHILCPGGSREEVTIDMEAGAKRYIEKWNELAPFANTKECFKAAFDAALGITEDKK